jgi:tetratricopeptide (TPR) repeat protein
MNRYARALGFAAALVLLARVAQADTPPASSPQNPSTTAPRRNVDTLVASLANGSTEQQSAAVMDASALGADYLAPITAALAALRSTNTTDIRSALKAARDTGASDLVTALSTLPHVDAPTRRRALTMVCLARSLAKMGTMPAARQLVLLGADVNGMLRPELARLIGEMGDHAVAALVEARLLTGDVRGWAGGMLESLGKRTPGDAVQTTDPQLLADILRAYGQVKDLDAVGAILPFANAERRQVRDAAREALTAYGSDATWKLKEAYAQVVGSPADESWSADELARWLFAALDKARLRDVYALLDEALAKQAAGDLAGAVAEFDAVLARQPDLNRRVEAVGGYYAYAVAIEAGDRAAASGALRKALALDPAGVRAPQIQSELAYLEGEELAASGIIDAEAYRRALALDPANARAESALSRIDEARAENASKVRKWTTASAVFALAVVCLILFAGTRKRSRAARA